MKRTLSLILALLLLASTLTACGETAVKETSAFQTDVVETNAPVETDAPTPVYPYDTSLITENGVAKAHIVLLDGASEQEKLAADELVLHIKKVSGADITVTNTAAENSLPIIIATPNSLPELETLFPDDLAWLRDIGKVGDKTRWGDDGFAVRQKEGKIYIFGTNAVGSLNGVYDFIEENLDVIWVRGNDDTGIIYDEMSTINVVKADYREKSPFDIRFHEETGLCGIFARRNKYSALGTVSTQRNIPVAFSFHPGAIHSVKWWVLYSPIYDPNINEYWETNEQGEHGNESTSGQINFWSQLTADTVAASVIADLGKYTDETRPKYINVTQEDCLFHTGVYPEMNEPFEYAPGQFVEPSDKAYLSTVFFTFINRVARKVAETYPDVTINTLVGVWTIEPPKCDLDDNVSIWFCPGNEDLTQESFEAVSGELPTEELKYFEAWVEKHPNVMLYTYYFTHYVFGWYERPIWYRVQKDFQYYADRGVLGLRVENRSGEGNDSMCNWQLAEVVQSQDHTSFFTADGASKMNQLSFWLFYKLAWNPYEDVDALIVEFCDKVYGDASEYMQEYYRLVTLGWNDGGEYMLEESLPTLRLINYPVDYFNYFIDVEVDGVHVLTAIQETLHKAYDAADDNGKEHIRYIMETYDNIEDLFFG